MNSPFMGLGVVKSSTALVMEEKWVVRKHPRPKRRRQWSVRRESSMVPGVIRLGRMLYVHPDIHDEFLKRIPTL